MDKVKGDAIEGFTLLHKAVFHSRVEELKSLLEAKKDDTVTNKPFDVNAKCVLKQTPLILCVRQHYEDANAGKGDEMGKLLLEHGAAVLEDGKLMRDAYGDATLHLAGMSCFKNGVGTMKMLVDKVRAARAAVRAPPPTGVGHAAPSRPALPRAVCRPASFRTP